jgi:hypothetical protein
MSIWFGYYCVDDLLVMMDGLAVLLRLPVTNTVNSQMKIGFGGGV